MKSDILVVDDEADIRELISGILEDEGYKVRVAGNSDAVFTAFKDRHPDLIVLDVWLQGSSMDGLELLDFCKKYYPDLPVVIISGHGNIETAVAAIRRGAYDYIEKPFKADKLLLLIARAFEATRLRRENHNLRTRLVYDDAFVGNSSVVRQLRHHLKIVAPGNSRVLLTGAPGTGKTLAARMIHTMSGRAQNPFIIFNTSLFSSASMAEEFFGTVSQTGEKIHRGALEKAYKGTLYIQEITAMTVEMQKRFLRVLVENQFSRIGENLPIDFDARIICSSSYNLQAAVRDGRLREDLYFRLNVVPIRIPSLCERREDIPALISYFLESLHHIGTYPRRRISENAIAVLQTASWHGNVRHLRNHVERILIMNRDSESEEITSHMLPLDKERDDISILNGKNSENLMGLTLKQARESFEREYIRAQLLRFGGHISKTAEFIGMERSAFHRKLKSLNIHLNTDSEVKNKQDENASSDLLVS